MPVYEYRCNHCQRKVSLYVRGFSESSAPVCSRCGSTDISRLFSTFAIRKTYIDGYQDILSDSQLTRGLMRNDPKALAEWNRKMSRGSDEEIAPEYEEMMERMDAGEMPTDIGAGGEAPGDLE